MSRRPTGHMSRKCLVFAALLVPWLQPVVEAQQQQRNPQQVRSPSEGDHVALGSPNLAATALTGQKVVETPQIIARRKNTVISQNADADTNGRAAASGYRRASQEFDNIVISHDASALDSLALDSSVRAPSLVRPRNPGAGISSQHALARSLEDWEVEDFVLLATIDGDLYATDRKSGDIMWHLEVEQPTVETKHYRANHSTTDGNFRPVDHWLWVVEPNTDGTLYLWVPGMDHHSIHPMPYTMKQMVENAPYEDKEQNILYTGEKKTTLITLHAATGRVLKWFSSTGSLINEQESCQKPNALAGLDEEECADVRRITLGRTEYTVNIRHPDGYAIATLKYSEWGPNSRDDDLIEQHRRSRDSQYITSQHDGRVLGFDHENSRLDRPAFAQKLASPVARVFDVIRRWHEAPGRTPDLVVLPHPPLPTDYDKTRHLVFLNQTEAGSWYALSGSRYPLIKEAPRAPIHSSDWANPSLPWEAMNQAQISKALIGTHPLPTAASSNSDFKSQTPLLTLPSKPSYEEKKDEDGPASIVGIPAAALPSERHLLNRASQLPAAAVHQLIDLVSNPTVYLFLVFGLWFFRNELRKWCRQKAKLVQKVIEPYAEIRQTEPVVTPMIADERASLLDPTQPITLAEQIDGEAPSIDAGKANDSSDDTISVEKAGTPFVTIDGPDKADRSSLEAEQGVEAAKGKKKAHRGRRGGVKHRKGKDKRELSQSREDAPETGIDEAVNRAKNSGLQPRLEPDIQTVTHDVEDVSGPILRMGGLEVNEDQQLGTGSNGTVVFAGKWKGRDVAVKRMLVQFNEIADQETKLLSESDDHPNVIRYYTQEERAAFLYIALELCQASLADVIQKPSMFRDLAHAGERNMPYVLYQVTNGLSHLHSLRIVHRDLKPQNILVNMGKNGKPRLFVSDFGLCKKLEGTNSSFGATTAHAAGTSGWRAPELLLDDTTPAPSGPVGMAPADPGSSFHSGGSGSGGLVGGLVGPNQRRVTRAIDIFSLGLVFFYVLTKGNHPFDCGDRYMREVNIRKGKYNLDLLDTLGDSAFEAHDLIAAMLSAYPRNRPSARDVMAHPFFWSPKKRLNFLCDVSDHFEKEPRDPPSDALMRLEDEAPRVVRDNFLDHLPKMFVDSLGKQRKYTGSRLLDLLRALRNKRNHYEDMSDALKNVVGSLPEGYLYFWTLRFPNLLITCWNVVYDVHWDDTLRFQEYYQPAGLDGVAGAS